MYGKVSSQEAPVIENQIKHLRSGWRQIVKIEAAAFGSAIGLEKLLTLRKIEAAVGLLAVSGWILAKNAIDGAGKVNAIEDLEEMLPYDEDASTETETSLTQLGSQIQEIHSIPDKIRLPRQR